MRLGAVEDERLEPVQVNLQAHEQNSTWRDDAACKGLDTTLFHPERGANVKRAKQVCQGCSVVGECLAYALVNYEKHGIWGGMSERQRRDLRAKLTRAGLLSPPLAPIQHGTEAGFSAHRRRGETPCRLCVEARNAAAACAKTA